MRLALGAAAVQMWRDVNIWLPQPAWLLGCCGKLWPLVPGLCDSPCPPLYPRGGAWLEGAGLAGENHPDPSISITDQKPAFSPGWTKETQGVTLLICYPLCSATGEGFASLFQGAGQTLGMGRGEILGGRAWAESLSSHQGGWLGSKSKWCFSCAGWVEAVTVCL